MLPGARSARPLTTIIAAVILSSLPSPLRLPPPSPITRLIDREVLSDTEPKPHSISTNPLLYAEDTAPVAPMAALLFIGLNVVLISTISPVYDFVCFLPYWERRIENHVVGAPCGVMDQMTSACGKSVVYIKGVSYASGQIQQFFWKVNKRTLWELVQNELYRGALNINLRIVNTVKQQHEERKEQLLRSRWILECSLLKIDDTLSSFRNSYIQG